jgi:hypothetical protein
MKKSIVKNPNLFMTISIKKDTLKILYKRIKDSIQFIFLFNDEVAGKSQMNTKTGILNSSMGKSYDTLRSINSAKLIADNLGILIFYTCYGRTFSYEYFPFGQGVYFLEICANEMGYA